MVTSVQGGVIAQRSGKRDTLVLAGATVSTAILVSSPPFSDRRLTDPATALWLPREHEGAVGRDANSRGVRV